MTRPDARHDEVLTYDNATPEQVAEARAKARRKLARREFLARLDVA
jgi:hypothetical protein